MSRSSATVENTINIDDAGEAVDLELNGRDTVTLHITEDAAASYQIDGRIIGGTWRDNIGPSEYSGGGPHSDTITFAAEEIRRQLTGGRGGVGGGTGGGSLRN